jgi:hypothetical protein
MFCHQCQETAKNTGCTVRGVCGKTEDTANLQDLLIHTLKGLAVCARQAGDKADIMDLGRFTIRALFSTITNANFDNDRIIALIREALKKREELKKEAGLSGHLAGCGPVVLGRRGRVPAESDVRGHPRHGERRHQLAALAAPVRHEGHCSLCGPRLHPGLSMTPRSTRSCSRARGHDQGPERGRAGGDGHGMREHRGEDHGAAGQGQHGNLRQPRGHQGEHRRPHEPRHPRVRPRPEGLRGAPEADRGHGR